MLSRREQIGILLIVWCVFWGLVIYCAYEAVDLP